jgi:hypothetical protein
MAFGRKIQNGQSAMAEGDTRPSINPDPGIIRAALGKLASHAAHQKSQIKLIPE